MLRTLVYVSAVALIALPVAATTTEVGLPETVEYTEPKPQDVVLLLDSSPSTQWTDPDNQRIRAAHLSHRLYGEPVTSS